jgi:haloalkane dehalogenase
MRTLRTPDDRFDGLPEFAFEPHYADIDDLDGGTMRVAYLDEGPPDAAPVLCMHGEPSWSFLYRHMLPVLVDAGHRVVCPDLVGFGRSDKPTEQSDYTYARHVGWMSQLVFGHLELRGVTFFGQDWGGLIGLRLVAAEPGRFDRVAVANTGLPTGDHAPSDAFLRWQHFAQTTEAFPVGAIVDRMTVTELSPEVVAGYDAPFPDDGYKAGARVFPSLVPTSPDDPAAPDNRAAWEQLRSWDKPLLCCFSDSDPITGGGDKPFRKLVPGARDQPHVTIEGGGHFLQEDRGPELAGVLADFIARTS